MGFRMKSGPDKNGIYEVKGSTATAKVAMFFGILLLIVGILGLFVNPIGAAIILFIANVILFARNRYHKRTSQRFINQYAQKQKQYDNNFTEGWN